MVTNTIHWLRQVPFFKGLADNNLMAIAGIAEEVQFREDQTIFEDQEIADALYIIKDGSVRIEQTYRDGRRKTLAVLTKENFFGEMAIITGGRRCASATSQGSATLIRVEKDAFMSCLEKNAELSLNILLVVCRRLQAADKEISNLTFQNLPGRIVQKILELGEQFGQLDEHGLTIQLSLTHYDLADMVGTNRESVSKYLSKFKKEGSIAVNHKRITILDRSKLLSWC